MLTIILAGAIIAISFAAPPGPVTMETIRHGLRGGFYPALKVQLGSIIGDMIWCLMALLGLASLVQVTWVRLILGVVGVLLLICLGVIGIRDAFREQKIAAAESASPLQNAFKSGMMISLANPTAIGYWISVGGALIATGVAGSTLIENTSFIAGFLGATFLWAFLMAFVVRWGRRLLTPIFFRFITFACGTALIIFGIMLASDMIQSFIS